MTDCVTIGDATLYLGDAREVLPEIGRVDALITDPPYGIEFKPKHGQLLYADDTENFRKVVLPAIREAIALAKRSAIFSGKTRLHEYPAPADIGGVFCPNGAGAHVWGWTCLHPVLFYGRRPTRERYPSTVRIAHPGLRATGERKDNDHPCPKPIAFMDWLVRLASKEGEMVLDPFMGSGTTGVACMQLDRRFIGIEIERRFFNIACRRLEAAQQQAEAA